MRKKAVQQGRSVTSGDGRESVSARCPGDESFIRTRPPRAEVVAHLQEIYAHGQRCGRNPHAFSKMGGSTVLNPKLLGLFDSPSRYNLGDYAYLQPTINHFSGSFSRYGVAAQHGLHAWSVFDPLWADKDWCETGEHMLACEIRLNNPALFIIRLGSNDAGAPTGFAKNVRDVVEYCLAVGVIPLLVTKADRFEGDNTNNDIIRQIATEYAIPLWDFDRVADTRPDRGLDTDQIHMKTATNHDYTLPETFTIGHSVQDLTGLMVLDALRAAPASAAPTEPGTLTNKMQGAWECVKCHGFSNPQELAGEPYITPVAWQASMMGNAARDPVFWAGVAIAHQDEPSETALSVRCHVPRAFLAGREDVIAIDELMADDLTGVDCELCHRLVKDDATPAGNAMYEVDDVLGSDGDVPKRGPWTYEGDPPKHGWMQDTYVGDSRACGTCHDVTTGGTRVDSEGKSLGIGFGEQRTYSEWRNSDYAVDGAGFNSCQDCHMPAVDNVAGCAEFKTQGIVHPTGGRRHDLAGANRRMVEILKGVYGLKIKKLN